MSRETGVSIDGGVATDWVRGSLAQGSELAMLMTQRLVELSKARMLVEGNDLTVLMPSDHGRGIESQSVDRIAVRVIQRLLKGGIKTLIVEDDGARRGDPNLTAEIAFIGDRIIRWVSADEGAAEVVRLLRSGSSGYPLNSYGCRSQAEDLSLIRGHTLSLSEHEIIVASTDLILVSVFDAEAYLMVMAPYLETYIES